MGIPFPTGLRLLEQRHKPSVRWAWSLNAAASVLGSVGALVLALYLGLVRNAADRRRIVSLRAGGDRDQPDGAGNRYAAGFGWGLGVRTFTRDGVAPGWTLSILHTT